MSSQHILLLCCSGPLAADIYTSLNRRKESFRGCDSIFSPVPYENSCVVSIKYGVKSILRLVLDKTATTRSENKARSCVVQNDCNERRKWEEVKEGRHQCQLSHESRDFGKMTWCCLVPCMGNNPAAAPL